MKWGNINLCTTENFELNSNYAECSPQSLHKYFSKHWENDKGKLSVLGSKTKPNAFATSVAP